MYGRLNYRTSLNDLIDSLEAEEWGLDLENLV